MTHATLDELTDAVHGFAPKPAHSCGPCDALERRLRAEFDLLRRAEARVTPRRKASFVPVAYAAALMLAITAAVMLYRGGSTIPAQEKKEPALADLIRKALEGDDESIKALRTRGPGILRPLSEARLAAGETKGSGAVADLVLELKKELQPDSAALLGQLDRIQITADFANASVASVLDYLQEVTGMTMVLDPVASPEAVSFKLNNVSVRRLCDAMSLLAKVEVDVRFGVIFVSTPDRLWGMTREPAPVAPLTDAQVKAARRLIQALGGESLEDRDKAVAELLKLGRAVIPVLEAQAKNGDKEIASRCKAIVEQLSPKPGAGSLPMAATFRTQKLAKDDEAVRANLERRKLDLNFEGTKLGDIAGFIRDFASLNIIVEKGLEPEITVKAANLPLSQILELIALPRGLDVKIENGVIVIFEVKK